ncbi:MULTISPECIES: DMT family transporter [Gammaproteobacteria]|uniref:DMT family transporter n=1 Tax=Gammaproteobacteria TaxID=1236 RepID=UPI000DCFF6E3|nr:MULTISPECIES: DMT family transporter [Gammaproteobacteria]RTE87753.1 DMT family transporter [Aliidiomarina sp. B3213]TCZ92465.1 DMT family transporter [Lysobacter sp. N42]
MNKTIIFTALALLAFAGNSILCRLALQETNIDPASFTSLRLISGAVTLWLLLLIKQGHPKTKGNFISALALFAYAAGFSFAYVSLDTGIGALILFGTVQVTMIAVGLYRGEKLYLLQIIGGLLAFFGLIALMSPGIHAPSLSGASLMALAGVSWGIYSLRSGTGNSPLQTTAGNFILAAPLAVLLSLFVMNGVSIDREGFVYALLSGAVTSGAGYAVWYAVLPYLKSSQAAVLQLTVPVLAAAGGVLLLQEPFTLRFVLSSIVILGGVALFISQKYKHA